MITLNLRQEWIAELGTNTVYINTMMGFSFNEPQVILWISDKPDYGFRAASCKPNSSGFSLNIPREKLLNVYGLLEEDAAYRCTLITSITKGCKIYKVVKEEPTHKLLDWADTKLSFSVSNKWHNNGRNASSRLLADEYKLYKRLVTNITAKKRKSKYFKETLNEGKNTIRDGDHIDHKVSTKTGFEEGISPEIIGSTANLRIIKARDNLSKRAKNSMSIEELYTEYNKLKATGDE